MLVGEIMKHRTFSVGQEAPLERVIANMQQCGIGFLPVTEQSGRVVGVITSRDVALRGRGSHTDARSLMTRKFVSCRPEELLPSVEERMAKAGVRRLVVLDGVGRLAGVLTLADIAQCEEPIRLARLVRRLFAGKYRATSPAG
jgi:CBS domain-containing protein